MSYPLLRFALCLVSVAPLLLAAIALTGCAKDSTSTAGSSASAALAPSLHHQNVAPPLPRRSAQQQEAAHREKADRNK